VGSEEPLGIELFRKTLGIVGPWRSVPRSPSAHKRLNAVLAYDPYLALAREAMQIESSLGLNSDALRIIHGTLP